MKKLIAAFAGALCLMAGTAFAHDYKIGDLVIVHPYARATPPGAPVSGGYMTIKNNGAEPDHLIAGSAEFAGKIELHEMTMDGDVMKMRPVAGGIEIPAGGEVELKPGGYHVMFMHLKEQMQAGEKRKTLLEFEKAGSIEVEFNVQEVKPGGDMSHGSMDHSSMNHDTMDHSGHAAMSMPGDDAGQIAAIMKAQFDRPEAPLSVEPVAMSGDWAVAGWAQEKQGGRALLSKTEHGWRILMCGGEGFRHADTLTRMGVPHHEAMKIAGELTRAESELGPEKVALFDSFEGVVEIGEGGHDHGQMNHSGHGG